MATGLDSIVIKGAREHNLKNVDLTLPRNQLIVVTGLSGSGKSSLAFDTIYAEGQRRYVESLSSYARQFLGQMEKPDVDYIEGLSPAISIDQKSTSRNPRSTVGTVTEVYDYLRLLYARIGTPHCYNCGREISTQSSEQIVDAIMDLPEGTRIQVLAPLVRGRKGEYAKLFEEVAKEGFARVRVDGEIKELREKITLDKKKKHTIEVVVDRLVIKPDIRKRLADSIETTLRLSTGIVTVLRQAQKDGADSEIVFSEAFACVHCGISFEELAPRLFSFNSPYGACPSCSGLGEKIEIDPWKVIPDRGKSIADGAIVPWSKSIGGGRFPSMNPYYLQQLERVLRKYRVKMSTPIEDMSDDVLDVILYGTEKEQDFAFTSRAGKTWEYRSSFEGVINNLQRRYSETSSDYVKEDIEKYMSASVCPTCKGARLKPEALAVTVGEVNIDAVTRMSIENAEAFFRALKLTPRQEQIANQIVKEVRARLGFLTNVGLNYLTLARSATTLSGGESQRIRLATQIGSALVGVLYILDEPSIGLHQRDNERLLATLRTLRDLGNTLIVIEHDEDTMRMADVIVDIGPGAGAEGGEILSVGSLEKILENPISETGAYLSGRKFIPIPRTRREPRGWLEVRKANANNVNGVDVKFPIGVFAAVTGVSGSGKSSLVNAVLGPRAQPVSAQSTRRRNVRHGQGRAATRQVGGDRPIADRPHAAFQPCHLHRHVRPHPRAVLDGPRRQIARLHAGALLVQRQRRALRVVRGRRHHQDRDALPSRRVRAVRSLQGQALQRPDARGQVQGQDDRRRTRDARRRRQRAVLGDSADSQQTQDDLRGRLGLHQNGAARHHAFGR